MRDVVAAVAATLAPVIAVAGLEIDAGVDEGAPLAVRVGSPAVGPDAGVAILLVVGLSPRAEYEVAGCVLAAAAAAVATEGTGGRPPKRALALWGASGVGPEIGARALPTTDEPAGVAPNLSLACGPNVRSARLRVLSVGFVMSLGEAVVARAALLLYVALAVIDPEPVVPIGLLVGACPGEVPGDAGAHSFDGATVLGCKLVAGACALGYPLATVGCCTVWPMPAVAAALGTVLLPGAGWLLLFASYSLSITDPGDIVPRYEPDDIGDLRRGVSVEVAWPAAGPVALPTWPAALVVAIGCVACACAAPGCGCEGEADCMEEPLIGYLPSMAGDPSRVAHAGT
mmetsp:Transcript_64297/g.119494  ORF Transcript_64297/g.119494 Transcript_64297/m.119494 type:complete len:343 (+) Transcript_64297:191-1219(+)